MEIENDDTFIDAFKAIRKSNDEDLIPFEQTKIDCCKKSVINCQICSENPSRYTCPKWYCLQFMLRINPGLLVWQIELDFK